MFEKSYFNEFLTHLRYLKKIIKEEDKNLIEKELCYIINEFEEFIKQDCVKVGDLGYCSPKFDNNICYRPYREVYHYSTIYFIVEFNYGGTYEPKFIELTGWQ